jgi:hypothetical protein
VHLTIAYVRPIIPRSGIVSGFKPFNRAKGRGKGSVANGGIYTKSGGYMEDRDKSKTTNSEDIVELTPDMVVPDESQVDIVDLTDVVDGPDEIAPPAAPVEEPSPAAGKPDSRPSAGSGLPNAIEQEVEAAFDFVASPILETAPEGESLPDHDGLMDKLSNIPQQVDDALDASGALDADEPEQMADSREAGAGVSEETVDAGGMDAIQEGLSPDEADDDIIELTDIVDPAEMDAAALQDGDDDEIIELTDIIDSAELEAAGMQVDDDDIIELTDIVDPAELHVGAVAPEPDAAGDWGPDSEATADQAADAASEDQEYEDLLETIDSLDTEDLLMEIEADGEQDQAPAFGEQDAEAMEATVADDAGSESDDASDEDLEYESLLETIDQLDPEDLLETVDEAGLLDDGDAGPADSEEGLLTLTDVLSEEESTEETPPVEGAGELTREVEEETGREVRTLTDQEIEAAVERILKSKYAETIERLIANAVEKAVNREIENLKQSMLDDE